MLGSPRKIVPMADEKNGYGGNEETPPFSKPILPSFHSFNPLAVDTQETAEQAAESMACSKLLLDYLSAHKNKVENDPDLLREFEQLTIKVLARFPNRNSKLFQVLVEEGWTESGYQLSLFRAMDEESLNLTLGKSLIPLYNHYDSHICMRRYFLFKPCSREALCISFNSRYKERSCNRRRQYQIILSKYITFVS